MIKVLSSKLLATEEDETIVAIPPVVRIVPIRVEPQLVTVTIHVEHVRVAIRVVIYRMPSISLPSVNA